MRCVIGTAAQCRPRRERHGAISRVSRRAICPVAAQFRAPCCRCDTRRHAGAALSARARCQAPGRAPAEGRRHCRRSGDPPRPRRCSPPCMPKLSRTAGVRPAFEDLLRMPGAAAAIALDHGRACRPSCSRAGRRTRRRSSPSRRGRRRSGAAWRGSFSTRSLPSWRARACARCFSKSPPPTPRHSAFIVRMGFAEAGRRKGYYQRKPRRRRTPSSCAGSFLREQAAGRGLVLIVLRSADPAADAAAAALRLVLAAHGPGVSDALPPAGLPHSRHPGRDHRASRPRRARCSSSAIM